MLSLSFFFSCSLVSLLWEKVNGVEAFGGHIPMAITSKVEKLLMASSSSKELKLLNPISNLNLSFNLPPPSHAHRLTASIDFDSEEDTFYDCQEWPCLASDSEDDFHSANGVFNPSWSSSESESPPPPPRPENNSTNWTNEAERVSSSEENNLSNFFFQDQFWNHDYRNVELQQRNKVVKAENQTELVQFLEDSFWFHQADAGGRRKSRSLPCFPCIGKSKGKGKPPATTVSTSIQNTHNYELPQRKNSSRASCLPKTFTWLRFRGRKKPRPASIHNL